MLRFCPILATVICLCTAIGAAQELRIQQPDRSMPRQPIRITGSGTVTSSSHPMHPGYYQSYALDFRLEIDPRDGEALIEFVTGDGEDRDVDRYYFRRGRLFQVDTADTEKLAGKFGDLSPAAIAAVHPLLVSIAMKERPENTRWDARKQFVFAWGEELWDVEVDSFDGRIRSLVRRFHDDIYGDSEERINFESALSDSASLLPAAVSVFSEGRETLRIAFDAPEIIESVTIAEGNHRRDRARLMNPDDIEFREIAPRLYAIEVASQNTRVIVAEFDDYLFVFEGVYNSRNCDMIAPRVERQFRKPVRYFSFSHLHNQYIGGVRSWIAEGATILTPPEVAPMVADIAARKFTYRPDRLAASLKPVNVEVVEEHYRIEDNTNKIVLYNVESDHTDEYIIVYFPDQKVLLTGDLLFYRDGRKLTGRSKKVCETVQALGLDVDQYVCTWPLTGYGTHNIVTREAMAAGCAD